MTNQTPKELILIAALSALCTVLVATATPRKASPTIESSSEYKACYKAVWAIYEPRGISTDAAYEFCTDDDEGDRAHTLNEAWRVQIESEK